MVTIIKKFKLLMNIVEAPFGGCLKHLNH